MKYVTPLLILLFSLNSYAQKWFTTENQWIYYSYTGIEVEEYKNDMVIGNDTFLVYSRRGISQLGGDTIITELPSLVVREEHDRVFYWNGSDEHVIYDFTMEVGDSINWQVGDVSGCYMIYFRIDSLFEVEIAGESIRVQEGTYRSYPWHNRYKVRVYEGIGVAEMKWQEDWDWSRTAFLIPDLGLTCYEDDYFRLICQFSNGRFTFPEKENECEDRIRPYRHEWFRESAQWINTVSSTTSSQESYNVISYGGDTIINNEEFRILDKTNLSLFGVEDTVSTKLEPLIVREKDSKVYYWNGDTTYLIYDMDMRVGDTIEWRPMGFYDFEEDITCSPYFILDKVFMRPSLYGPLHLIQEGRLIQNHWQSEDRIQIYEGIGWVTTFNDFSDRWEFFGNLVPDNILTCYFDGLDDSGVFCQFRSNSYGFPDISDCLALTSSLNDKSIDSELYISPNPSYEFIRLEGEFSAEYQYSIFGIDGKRLISDKIDDGFIDVLSLPSGTYFLTLYAEQISPKSFKFIKF